MLLTDYRTYLRREPEPQKSTPTREWLAYFRRSHGRIQTIYYTTGAALAELWRFIEGLTDEEADLLLPLHLHASGIRLTLLDDMIVLGNFVISVGESEAELIPTAFWAVPDSHIAEALRMVGWTVPDPAELDDFLNGRGPEEANEP